MIGHSNDETNFSHKFMLTNRQISNLSKAFASCSSADVKLSKTQLSKMKQLGGFLGRLLGPLLKTGLPLIKNVIQPLAKSVLIPLGLTAAASAAVTGKNKNFLGSAHNTTLIISNDEMEDIKIVQAFEDSELSLKGVSERGFLSMLLVTLGASSLGNMLAGKGIIRAEYGSKGKEIFRAGYGSK